MHARAHSVRVNVAAVLSCGPTAKSYLDARVYRLVTLPSLFSAIARRASQSVTISRWRREMWVDLPCLARHGLYNCVACERDFLSRLLNNPLFYPNCALAPPNASPIFRTFHPETQQRFTVQTVGFCKTTTARKNNEQRVPVEIENLRNNRRTFVLLKTLQNIKTAGACPPQFLSTPTYLTKVRNNRYHPKL